MSIASEITRIAGLRDTIRTKLIDFGIITNTSAKLTDCATAIEGIDEAMLTVPSLSITSNPTIDNSTGLVSISGSASGTTSVSEGYSKGLSKSISVPVSGSLQLTTQGAQTITPGTSNKTIAANQWLTGAQTIKGDSNLVAANIVSGKSIFGVSGSAPAYTARSLTITGDKAVGVFYGDKSYYQYLPVNISGISPRYLYMKKDSSSTYRYVTYAVLNGTYVTYGYKMYTNASSYASITGSTLGMSGTNLLIPIGSGTVNRASYFDANDIFTVYLIGV